MPFVPLTEPPDLLAPLGRWYHVCDGEILIVGAQEVPVGPSSVVPADTEAVFLGMLDGQPCWGVGAPAASPEPAGARWLPLMALGSSWSTTEWTVAGRAVQLVEWLRTSRYCGRCATASVALPGERARRCPACGLLAFPRLAPAVIVLVQRAGQALLARNARFPVPMFSTLAGFVEPGETLEEAVRREVAEEVGVRVGAMRYFGSQPWPFPHSLMVGFLADWAEGEIEVDGVEIAEAGWYEPGQLPAIPPTISIARQLIDAWLAEATA